MTEAVTGTDGYTECTLTINEAKRAIAQYLARQTDRKVDAEDVHFYQNLDGTGLTVRAFCRPERFCPQERGNGTSR